MKKILLCAVVLFLCAGSASAVEVSKFKRPVYKLLNPVFSAYYDNQPGAGLLNYYCGADTTYNGHQGTDFRATVGTNVYASAFGGLYYRVDNCPNYGFWGSTCGWGYGNHARLDHQGDMTDGQGLITIYAHLKKGTVAWYKSLQCSQYLGKTASSGNSTGPHLHFEVRKYGYPYDDPFAGACSGAESFWVKQNFGIPSVMCQK